MNSEFCEFEPKIIRAIQTGQWDETTRRHHDQCPICREAAALAQGVARIAFEDAKLAPPTPDPLAMILKAEFAERQRRQRIVRRIAAVAYSLLMVIAGVAIFSLIRSAQPTSLGEPLTPASGALSHGIFSIPILISLIAVLLVLLPTFGMRWQSR